MKIVKRLSSCTAIAVDKDGKKFMVRLHLGQFGEILDVEKISKTEEE